jgi:hypothetical protein
MTPYRRKMAIAILIWTAGALLLAAAVVRLVVVLAEPIHDFRAPGSISAQLERGDEKAILLQLRGSGLDDSNAAGIDSADLDCVARSTDGERVVWARRIGSYTVTHNRDTYVAKVGFTAPATGGYVVRCDLHDTPIEHAPLGFSDHAHGGRLLLEVFGALALCAATIMAGVLVARRARREAEGPTRP